VGRPLTTSASPGIFLTKETAQAIINGGAKKVVSSAPAKDDSQVVVMGANADEYNGSENFVSCASCTTNGLAPMVKAIHDKYDVQEALMTTVHAMTVPRPSSTPPAATTGAGAAPPPATSSPRPPAPPKPRPRSSPASRASSPAWPSVSPPSTCPSST
jgi:glyceraldehyde-3-phosphate dehydrogenase/erythrose-4-phosphate dehydrogenase